MSIPDTTPSAAEKLPPPSAMPCGAPLAIVHPGLDEGLDGVEAVVRHQVLQPALAGPAGADLGAIVAMPDLRDADLLQPHADDVGLILEALLDPHARKMHPLLVDRLGIGQV